MGRERFINFTNFLSLGSVYFSVEEYLDSFIFLHRISPLKIETKAISMSFTSTVGGC